MSTMLEGLLSRVASFLEERKLDYMVIGGFALPSYGAVRATVDLDVAVRIKDSKEFDSFVDEARKSGFSPSLASFAKPVSVFSEKKTGLDVEVWLRPDGVVWDRQTLARRRRTKIGAAEVWLISPEDFVVSKLSRPDRGVQDEKDAKSALQRLGDSIDRDYLYRRAEKAGVSGLLRAVEDAS